MALAVSTVIVRELKTVDPLAIPEAATLPSLSLTAVSFLPVLTSMPPVKGAV
jgi:hypothetical protein